MKIARGVRLIAARICMAAMCLIAAMNMSVKAQVDSVRRQVEVDQKLFSDIGL